MATKTRVDDLASVMRNVCSAKGQTGTRRTEFEFDTQLSAERARALELLKGVRVLRTRARLAGNPPGGP